MWMILFDKPTSSYHVVTQEDADKYDDKGEPIVPQATWGFLDSLVILTAHAKKQGLGHYTVNIHRTR